MSDRRSGRGLSGNARVRDLRFARLRDAILLSVGSLGFSLCALLVLAQVKAGNVLAGYVGIRPATLYGTIAASGALALAAWTTYALLPPPKPPPAASGLTGDRGGA